MEKVTEKSESTELQPQKDDSGPISVKAQPSTSKMSIRRRDNYQSSYSLIKMLDDASRIVAKSNMSTFKRIDQQRKQGY